MTQRRCAARLAVARPRVVGTALGRPDQGSLVESEVSPREDALGDSWQRPTRGGRPSPPDGWAEPAPGPILLPVAGGPGGGVGADDAGLLREGLGGLPGHSGLGGRGPRGGGGPLLGRVRGALRGR